MQYGQAFFFYTTFLKITDIASVVGIWHLTWYWRFYSSLFPITKGIPEFGLYRKATLPLALVFCAVFHVIGAYRKDRVHFGFRSLKKVFQGVVLGTLVFVSSLYFLEQVNISRLYLACFASLCFLGLSANRAAGHLLWTFFEKHFIAPIRTLLIGHGQLLQTYVERLRQRAPYPIDWVGRLGPEGSRREFEKIHYLGPEDLLLEKLTQSKINSVVISYPTEDSQNYEKILREVSNEAVEVKVVPDFGRYSTFTYTAEQECGTPLLAFNRAPLGTSDRVLKRVEDIVGSLFFMSLFSPVYLFIAALIKLTSKGPIFYSQLRMGADGKLFTLYKFRSMRLDAEKETGAVWAKENDNRTTPIGKWLRQTSLDEIPQFYNVLRGDMSLVGPRPERPVFVNQFRKEIPRYMLRHRIKSGITGWAQVNGWRGNTSIEERIKHDLYYIGHWSHYFDIKILCLTLIKGFVHRHAY